MDYLFVYAWSNNSRRAAENMVKITLKVKEKMRKQNEMRWYQKYKQTHIKQRYMKLGFLIQLNNNYYIYSNAPCCTCWFDCTILMY